jgi:hypothetical protein
MVAIANPRFPGSDRAGNPRAIIAFDAMLGRQRTLA